jgi:hypothetical protein
MKGRISITAVVLLMAASWVLTRPLTVSATHLGIPDVPGLRTALPNEGYLAYMANPLVLRFGEEWTGWIDVRHPSLGVPPNTMFGYDRSDRFVRVRSTILIDSVGAVAPFDRVTDFHFANRTYMLQAGLSVINIGGRIIASADIPGGFTFPLAPPAVAALGAVAPNGPPPIIDLYYADLLIPGGFSRWPSRAPGLGNEFIFLDNIPPPGSGLLQTGDTFAHEVYHFLSDGIAGHLPIPGNLSHASEPRNLIADGTLIWSPGMKACAQDPVLCLPPWAISSSSDPTPVVVGPPMSTVTGLPGGRPLIGGVSQLIDNQAGIMFLNAPAGGPLAPWLPANQRGDNHAEAIA